MFVLTLTFEDPEDAGYFTNKTLNKLHGYMQHEKAKLALFFSVRYIKIYAENKETLQHLLENKAICFDIRRNIFQAELYAVTDETIQVLKRVHNVIYNTSKKVSERIKYYTDKDISIIDPDDKDLIKEYKKKLRQYYQNKKQKHIEKRRKYFVIKKDKHKKFTIWVEVHEIKISEFSTTDFNTYGLIH